MTENVKGLRRLIKALEKAPKELESAINLEVQESANDIVEQAKRDVPVGTPESTGIKGYVGGTLRNSIRTEVIDKQTVKVVADAANSDRVQYGKFVEFGTSKMGARPFLYPAFFKFRNRLIDKIENATDKIIGKI